MQLRNYGFAFTEAIVVYISIWYCLKPVFCSNSFRVSLSSPGIENLQSRNDDLQPEIQMSTLPLRAPMITVASKSYGHSSMLTFCIIPKLLHFN